uniref:Uncharacterized protein n=1 Tax=Fusarium oxysporum (strain Fo5176) TaxID=660025 RepID=A0A0D2YBA2_FUSOF
MLLSQLMIKRFRVDVQRKQVRCNACCIAQIVHARSWL